MPVAGRAALERAMKIYFCDLCNESIRQEDLERSRVTTSRGKLICAKCVPPGESGAAGGSVVAAVAAGRRGGGATLALVALLALAGAGLGGAALWDAAESRKQLSVLRELAAKDADHDATIGRIVEDASLARGRVESIATRVEKLAAEPGVLREALADQLQRLEQVERGHNELRTLLHSLRSDREQVQQLELVQGRLDHDLSELRNVVQGLAARITTLGTAPLAPATTAGGAAPESAAPAFDAEARRLLEQLKDKDEGVRWTAVDLLAKRRDPAIVPHLLPMLGDRDLFVRFRTIQAMKELGARGAVARLIALLRDDHQLVREEAQDALVALTGNTQRQNVVEGTPAEREKGVKAWEEWYEKNKESYPVAGAAGTSSP